MARSTPKLKVLFLCTGNACRSQMAEGWARRLKGDIIEPYSAGVAPKGLDPRAVRVMAEVGVDISRQRSKHLDELRGVDFDYVVTLCDDARESCPVFPGPSIPPAVRQAGLRAGPEPVERAGKAQVIHAGFDDPPRLAADARTEEEALTHYRRVRDDIRVFIETLPEAFTRMPRKPPA